MQSVSEIKAISYVIETKDRTRFIYEISDKSKIHFNGKELTVIQGSTIYSHPLTDLHSMYYEDSSSKIENVKSLNSFKIENGIISINSYEPRISVRIISTSGLVLRESSSSAGTISIPVSGLPSGIYILDINGKTTKFQLK